MQNNDLKLASISSRILAFLLDDFIISLIVVIAFWEKIVLLGSTFDNDTIIHITNTLFMPLIVLKVIYQTFFVWYYGATIGKMLFKIRVIDTNSWGKVSFFQALLRSISRIVSQVVSYLGFIVAFFNEGKKTFHDFVGRTLVVNA